MARKLRSSQPSNIGIFMPGMFFRDRINSYYLGEFLKKISILVNDNDYQLSVQVPRATQDRYAYLNAVEGKNIDAAIIVFPEHNDPGLEELDKNNVPVVLVGCTSGSLDYVMPDSKQGAAQVMEHLIELGNRDIAFIGGSVNRISFQDRLETYRNKLSEHNIPVNENLVIPCSNADEKAGYEGMKRLLGHKPTAVFASSDVIAMGAFRAIQEAGLRIPEDVAVAGFDDMPFAALTNPSLTTVNVPFDEIGAEAFNMLIKRIKENPLERQVNMFPAELIIRGSTSKAVHQG